MSNLPLSTPFTFFNDLVALGAERLPTLNWAGLTEAGPLLVPQLALYGANKYGQYYNRNYIDKANRDAEVASIIDQINSGVILDDEGNPLANINDVPLRNTPTLPANLPAQHTDIDTKGISIKNAENIPSNDIRKFNALAEKKSTGPFANKFKTFDSYMYAIQKDAYHRAQAITKKKGTDGYSVNQLKKDLESSEALYNKRLQEGINHFGKDAYFTWLKANSWGDDSQLRDQVF